MKVILLFSLAILNDAWKTKAERDEKDGIYEISIPEYETLPETDVLLIDDIEVDPTRNAVSGSDQLWPGGVVPYIIHTEYPSVVRDKILAAMREIEQSVNSPDKKDCIHFKHRTTERDYIKVLPRGSRCSSAVGRQNNGRQEVSIGRGCESQGVIMHELLHSLGFHHEHTRSDRDRYLNINYQNLQDSKKHNFYQHPGDRTLHTQYDYSSILHYGPYMFAVDKSRPVFTPRLPVPAGVQIGQRLELSENDVRKIQRLYKCKVDTSHVVRRVTSSGQRCDFCQGLCDFTQDTTDGFDWSIQSGPSASGPLAGLTTGTDSYAIAKAAGHVMASARLVSKWFTSEKLCVDYSFFFYGNNWVGNGRLKLSVQPKNKRWSSTKKRYSMSLSRKWLHMRNEIIFTKNVPYQLVFEAEIFKTDIALDNINIYKGGCV